MDAVFGSVWNRLRSFSFDVPKITNDLIEVMNRVLGYIAGTPEKVDDVNDPWQNMAIKGPSKFSSMGKPFDDVLIKFKNKRQKLSKTISDDEWRLVLKAVGHFGGDDTITLGISGKTLTTDILQPSFSVSNDSKCKVELNVKAHELLTLNFGASNKLDVFALWSAANFEHSKTVLNAKLLHNPDSKVTDILFSGVFGQKFGNVGVLAGIDLAHDTSHESNWKQMCQAVSFGVVFPTLATRVTVQPNHDKFTVEAYWKIKDSLELAARAKNNYRSLGWTKTDNEIGLKYKYSKSMWYGVKSDLAGNITAGITWRNSLPCKMTLHVSSSVVRNIGKIKKFGIAVEF